ncbi:LOW QUALITY PROTEIN: zinc finger E-box-binding homeobox 1-like [Menidia menidia]
MPVLVEMSALSRRPPRHRGGRDTPCQAAPEGPSAAEGVTNFNNGLEASSDSDDEDKLHIVEEDSLLEPEAPDADGSALPDSHDAAIAVLPHNGSWNGVKEECMSEEEEEEEVKDALVEEILQQGDTAIIYPEAPEDEQSPAETGGADENGTPDSFSQLHTCPYCSRGYKRNASLKEHIKYRHETSEDNYSCSHCSYTFTYRSQLERHMSHHRGSREQHHVSGTTGGSGGTGGTRKFKCNECSKAFKYKHHLKEHLRIHSGEKPYECSNCKRRFSHSGSYSSHISSKKCVGAAPANGVTRLVIKSPSPSAQSRPVTIAPARVLIKEKAESKPLQEQLPVTQIKSEPVEYECKPLTAAPPATPPAAHAVAQPTAAAVGAAANLPQGVAMVVPTVGLVSPVSINLSDLQSVLKVAMDGNVLRQVLGSANGVVAPGKQGIVVQQPQQQIISLPAFVDHDGTTKIIINYSISPAAAAGATATGQPTPLLVKSQLAAAAATPAATATQTQAERAPTPEVADLTLVKKEPQCEPLDALPAAPEEEMAAPVDLSEPAAASRVAGSGGACLLCDDCPDNLEALHLLQHRKAANGEAVDSAALDPSFAALLSEAGVTLAEPSPVDDLLSLLRTYFASNANPGEAELARIAQSVSIPVEVVRKWFAKMNCGKRAGERNKEAAAPAVGSKRPAPEDASSQNGEEAESSGAPSDYGSPPGALTGGLVIVKSEPEDGEADGEAGDSQAEPLDLSLPKQAMAAMAAKAAAKVAGAPAGKQQEQPLNLSCQLKGRTIYVAAPPAGIVATAAQLPALVAIAGHQGGAAVGCLGAKRTILIPQLTYTYAAPTAAAAGAKTVVLNGHKVQDSRPESSPDAGVGGGPEEQSDAKKRRLENGVYPCDLCSKVFQKGSSLLRHKYEHTGKRPHECSICNKAFKHKHHLIEHSRLHSGEKPYQCDKCGKRFSHSGSYSQHMNHRYSYCKKDGAGGGGGGGGAPGTRRPMAEPGSPGGGGGGGPQSDSRTTTPPSQMDSDERESEEEEEEEEEEEDEDEEAMCMDDIRVVQVDDGECEIYEGNFEEEEEEEGGETEGQGGQQEFACDVVEVELGEGPAGEEAPDAGAPDCEAAGPDNGKEAGNADVPAKEAAANG